MTPFTHALAVGIDALRMVFLGAAAVAGLLCAVEWGVRTHRLSAFSPVARGARRLMGPIIAPVEKRVVRAGGVPSSAPWWTLVGIVIGGIIVLSLLDFVRAEAISVSFAANAGPRALLRLLVGWAFAVLYIALLITVVASWIQLNPFGRVVRTARALTEPLLGPIRRQLPLLFGGIDISPIVAYVILRMIEWVIMRLL